MFIGECIGNGTEDEHQQNTIDLNRVHFIHLGRITMSTNQSTGFKARELKSITVKCNGAYVKLLINKAYRNKYNRDQQVSSIRICMEFK